MSALVFACHFMVHWSTLSVYGSLVHWYTHFLRVISGRDQEKSSRSSISKPMHQSDATTDKNCASHLNGPSLRHRIRCARCVRRNCFLACARRLMSLCTCVDWQLFGGMRQASCIMLTTRVCVRTRRSYKLRSLFIVTDVSMGRPYVFTTGCQQPSAGRGLGPGSSPAKLSFAW